MGRVLSQKSKVYQFNSCSAHMPGLQVPSVGVPTRRQLICVSVSRRCIDVSLPPSLPNLPLSTAKKKTPKQKTYPPGPRVTEQEVQMLAHSAQAPPLPPSLPPSLQGSLRTQAQALALPRTSLPQNKAWLLRSPRKVTCPERLSPDPLM